jgi:cytochrome P450
MPLPPGPRLPVAVQTLAFGLRAIGFMERCRRRYGDTFTLRLPAGRTLVMFSRPDAIRDIFAASPEDATAGDSNAFALEPFVGTGSLLLLDGQRHLDERRLMLPPFHGERMRAYIGLIAEITRDDVASWPVGTPFPLRSRTQAITFEVILRAVFGLDEGDRLHAVRGATAGMLRFASKPLLMLPALRRDLGPLTPWRSFVEVRTRVRAAIVDMIRERRADPRVSERGDILSLLVQARRPDGSGLGDDELCDELLTLLLAGHETTATALAWTFDLVLHDRAVLHRLQTDIDDDTYVDAVIKEALRLRPVIPEVGRRLVRPMTIGGIDLPAGVFAVPNIVLVHRREDVYPDPLAFRPERFLGRRPDPYAWLPFGGGTRRCLGASFALTEMRVVLRTVLNSTRLAAADPAEERVRRRIVTLAPRHGTRVVLDVRDADALPPVMRTSQHACPADATHV